MQTNCNVIHRARKFGFPHISKKNIKDVENNLNFRFSKDFLYISSESDYEYFLSSGYEFYSFEGVGGYTVVGETIKLREKCGLPSEFAVLCIVDDVSVILLKTENKGSNEVILCSMSDFFNICKKNHMTESPTIFSSFMDFFEFLVEKEEKNTKLKLKNNDYQCGADF